MDESEINTVSNIGKHDPEAIARATGMKDLDTTDPAHDQDVVSKENIVPIILGVAGVATAVVLGGQAVTGNTPPPEPKKTLIEHAQDAASKPYDPATDTIVIKGLTIGPSSKNGTASEAVLNDPQVQSYIAKHPDESSSLTTSAESLNSSDAPFDVVKRDIDGDGDTDAVAVPAK